MIFVRFTEAFNPPVFSEIILTVCPPFAPLFSHSSHGAGCNVKSVRVVLGCEQHMERRVKCSKTTNCTMNAINETVLPPKIKINKVSSPFISIPTSLFKTSITKDVNNCVPCTTTARNSMLHSTLEEQPLLAPHEYQRCLAAHNKHSYNTKSLKKKEKKLRSLGHR